MPLQGSKYASALKSIGFPKSASEAKQKWEQAWKDFASGCTQAISTGSSYSLAGAFEPTSSTTKFADKLESAGKADIATWSLQVNNGTTTPPTSPLGWSPKNSETISSPAGELGDKYATFAKSANSTGSSYSLAGAFEPTSSTTKFADKLESAGKADIATWSLQVNNGTTTPPTSPLGWSPKNSETISSPAGELGDKYATFAKSANSTGIPPTFSGLGPLS